MDRTDMVLESEHETVIELIDLIGAEHTRKLVDTFDGSQMYIPQLKNITGEYRNQNIYDDFLSGMNYSELRHKYKLSEKTIRAIVNVEREKKKDGQKMNKNENTEQVQETEAIHETAPEIVIDYKAITDRACDGASPRCTGTP